MKLTCFKYSTLFSYYSYHIITTGRGYLFSNQLRWSVC